MNDSFTNDEHDGDSPSGGIRMEVPRTLTHTNSASKHHTTHASINVNSGQKGGEEEILKIPINNGPNSYWDP